MALAAAPAFADSMSASLGSCAPVVSAKYKEWKQPRLYIDETKTFADGSTQNDKLVLTLAVVYKEHLGGWKTAQLKLPQRTAPSVDRVLEDMRLAACMPGASVQQNGQQATLYTYTYLPNADGSVAHGSMWISDTTGLPVHEEMQEGGPPANSLVANAISATYVYNEDVRIPRSAELAQSTRLNNNAAVVRNMQSGTAGGIGGPQQ
jgi:hypothetical protein